uniref:WD40 repeat domain 95 n=1 Tax=Cyclopterus lumpus TaxID=8103 RepID=A0A8C2XG31_CYCLU
NALIVSRVKTFDLCQKHSLLVTGGMDRLVRMWNPHFSGKPTGILKGHSAPIVHLYILSEDSQIFSVSRDNTVKIWDIQDQYCLFTADPKASGIQGDMSACSYSSATKCFYIAADCMAVLSLKIRPRLHSRRTVSHDETVMCCGYSEEFRQVVSCTERSVVKVWDFDTGRQVFEFGGTNDLSATTCLDFDPKGRRLITGGRDGCLKIWNFNNGNTILSKGECQEVCDCIFLQVHRNFYVMSVGRDRKIDIYPDIPEDLHHVQRPQPSWQDDLKNGHKEDILCVAQCPPSLVATSSYDGEIIVWNVVSGRIQCRFVSPFLAENQNVEGLDTSVPSIIFLKNSKLQHLFSATALLSSGDLVPEMPSLISSHVSLFLSSLQVVDNDQVVLTSSIDYTVRLWSAHGEFIGTFGQSESWGVNISSSWKHPAVPYEVLIDPLSMPDHEILNANTRQCMFARMFLDKGDTDTD